MQQHNTYNNCLIGFKSDISGIKPPEKFTFPFYYDAHALCRAAASELQAYLSKRHSWLHDFNALGNKGGDGGKMFGVLVVEEPDGTLGYLAAFSGNLAGRNHWPHFVPPIFDLQNRSGFFKREEGLISQINQQIANLEQSSDLISYRKKLKETQDLSETQLCISRKAMKAAKTRRKHARSTKAEELSPEGYDAFLNLLTRESQQEKRDYKQLLRKCRSEIGAAQSKLENFLTKIEGLKEERKWRSASLQHKLFDKYQFKNAQDETLSAVEIFDNWSDSLPPAGTGECAAPKLLQYAYIHHLKPVAMAEFWWGQSPVSEIRKHKHFYPSCRSKCEPLLHHMLKGLVVDDNPLEALTTQGSNLETVYEDDALAIINKPANFLSVPGKGRADSVLNRMQQKYPNATGPLLVHRLDMSTSGLIVVAKTKEAHKVLQEQFQKRTVAKRYVALLQGNLPTDEGIVDLPLRVDVDDRPRQLVCRTYGKAAQTRWDVVERKDGMTRVNFNPVTGRTHQLRVHAAHHKGLNHPIVGDELYGTKADRLYLHAEEIRFRHPVTNKAITVTKKAEF